MNNNTQMIEFLDAFKQIIREEINLADTGPRLLSLQETAERLSISAIYLTKHVMHQSDFPKPVRIKERGSLRFYEHEINDYIFRLRERRQ